MEWTGNTPRVHRRRPEHRTPTACFVGADASTDAIDAIITGRPRMRVDLAYTAVAAVVLRPPTAISMPIYALSIHAGYACQRSGACCKAGWSIPVEAPLRVLLG